MEKEKYVAPETEIVEFEAVDMSADVVATSGTTGTTTDGPVLR